MRTQNIEIRGRKLIASYQDGFNYHEIDVTPVFYFLKDFFTGDWRLQMEKMAEVLEKPSVTAEYKPDCIRCNDNGCPACDGTKGSKFNPEPY